MKISKQIFNRKKPFWSLEFFPPKEPAQWPGFYKVVENFLDVKPLFVSVTYGAGGGNQDNTLDITAYLKQEFNLETMAHLTCVGATKDKIKDFLNSLRKEEVLNILALRGDAPKDSNFEFKSSQFPFASDLICFIKQEFPEFGIAGACYPSPHPESLTIKDDISSTKLKVDMGSDLLITQLFFDVRQYIDMDQRLKELGVNVPIIPGILPIQSFDSIKRILSLCGASIPGSLYLTLEEASLNNGAEAVKEVGIVFAVEQICRLLDYGVCGIHLYTLNKTEVCLDVIARVRAKGYDL